jgi:hypothetical protein
MTHALYAHMNNKRKKKEHINDELGKGERQQMTERKVSLPGKEDHMDMLSKYLKQPGTSGSRL